MAQARSEATLPTPQQRPAWLRPELCSWGAPAQEPLFPPRSQRPLKRSPSLAQGCHLAPRQSQLPTPHVGEHPQPVSPRDSPPSPKSTGLEPTARCGRCVQVSPPHCTQPTLQTPLTLEPTLAPSLSPECEEKQQKCWEKLSFKCCQRLSWAKDTS